MILDVNIAWIKKWHSFQKNNINGGIAPGSYVVNENNKNWGIGQVQSSIDEKITINFEHVGKKVININNVPLKIVKLKWV